MKYSDIIKNGVYRKNALFVTLLGLCPSLAVTSSLTNAFGMGFSVIVILTCSNVVISALRKVIPPSIRIPAYIGIIATFVTIVQMLLEAFAFSIFEALGIYLPLIVVNCIILERAESFASKNPILKSAVDGIFVGLGFTIAIATISFFREILGSGTLFGKTIIPAEYNITLFVLAPGAFLTLGVILAVFAYNKNRKESKEA